MVIEYPTWLGRWISGLRYLWEGPELVLQSHVSTAVFFRSDMSDGSQKPGVPCAVRTPETYYVHLSSESHIKQLIEAPEEQLSLHALSKDVWILCNQPLHHG